MSAFEGFGIEQVPELEEHEECEEHRQIVRRYRSVNRVKLEIVGKELTGRKGRQFGFRAVFQILEEAEKHEHEHGTHTDDKPFHRTIDNKVRHLARLVLHHLHARRQRCQREGGKCVHNQVHPQHLCHRQRRVLTGKRTNQHNHTCHEVHRKLEEDKTLDILIE